MTGLRWPIVTRIVVAHLTVEIPRATLCEGVRPRDLKALMPVVVVTRGPGSDDGVTDTPSVDVETYASSDDAMWDHAEDVRQAMHRLAGATAGGVLVDTVRTSVSPVDVPYGTGVHRAVATYRIGLRKQLSGP